MTKQILLYSILCLIVMPAYGIKPGVYYCVTQYFNGIQRNPNTGAIAHGDLKPLKNKFILKVKEFHQHEFVDAEECIKNPSCDCNKKNKCLSSYEMSIAKIKDATNEKKYYIELPPEKSGMTDGQLIGISEYLYYGDMTMFWISADFDYSLNILDFRTPGDHMNSYIESGHCESFE